MGQIEYPPGTRQTVIQVVESEPFGPIDVDALGNGGSPITIQDDLDLAGSAIDDTTQNFLDLTGDGNDIRVATGKAIEDGSGTQRIQFQTDSTALKDETGGTRIQIEDGDRLRLNAGSTTPFQIADTEGGFIAVQYDTDSGAGVLRTPNAGVRAEADGAPSTGTGLELRHNGSTGIVISYDRDSANYQQLNVRGNPLNLYGDGGLIDMSQSAADLRLANDTAVEFQNSGGTAREVLRLNGADNINLGDSESGIGGINIFVDGSLEAKFRSDGYHDFRSNDLRLATGQSIEDGSGTQRFGIPADETTIYDSAGNRAFRSKDASETYLFAESDRPVKIWDEEGGFDAVEYQTSSSPPGTLELTNADLDASGQSVTAESVNTGDLDTDRSWTDVTSSRSLDTQETNDTDSEIKAVVVVAPDADGTVVNIQGVIGGSGSFGGKKHDTRDTSQDLSIYLQSIPPNTTYQVVSFGDTSDYSLAFWGEYR